MTTQRNRLAAAFHKAVCCEHEFGDEPDDLDVEFADALLGLGVRVVDTETLAAAFMVTAFPEGDPPYDVGPTWAHTFAKRILAALDGVTMTTQRDRLALGVRVVDDGPISLFLLWNGEYDDFHLVGIFTTPVGAMEAHEVRGHRWRLRKSVAPSREWDCEPPDSTLSGVAIAGTCLYVIQEWQSGTVAD